MTKSIKPLLNDKNYIAALAIDQRGALKRLLGEDAKTEDLEQFKVHVSEELTPYASSILLDPEYGLPATKVRAKNAGLLLAYEKTGYDASEPGRLPDLLNVWSVKRLK
ncbi:MAG: tagatose-bisphosphate aldolase, partial [Staphylococcus simulans]